MRSSADRYRLPTTSVLLALGGVLLAASIGEIGLRVIGFSYVVFGKPDLIRGISLQPGLTGWQTSEGMAYVKINSHGYRDRERTKAKPGGVYRIAVLGDSFVEARQVALEHTVCAVLERMLSVKSPYEGKAVEVLNFGVAGYGTAQELLTLRQDVYAFAPDHVILAFFTGNDVADNSRALSHSVRARPYFTLRGDDLVLDTSFRQSATFNDRQSWMAGIYYAIQDYSRILQLTYFAWEGLHRNRSVHPDPFSELGLEERIYQEPRDRVWREAWHITERLIREMHDGLRGQGIAFGVVTLNNPVQVYPDVAARRQLMKRLDVDDLFYPERRIKSLGGEAGFPVLNLAPKIQQYADEHRVFVHGFKNTQPGIGHWNEAGHRLAGTMIAEWLSELTKAKSQDTRRRPETNA